MGKSKVPRMQTTTTTHYGGDEEDDEDEMMGITTAPPIPFLTVQNQITKCGSDIPCWGCLNGFGRPRLLGKHAGFDRLNEAWIANRDIMDDETMSERLGELHEEFVHVPEVSAGRLDAIPWTPADILRHLRTHMTDARQSLLSTLRDHNIIEAQLKNCVFVTGEDGVQTVVDRAALKQYLELTKSKVTLTAAIAKM